MRGTWIFGALALLASSCAAVPDRPSGHLEVVDLTDEFDTVWNEVSRLPAAARATAFKARFATILPGFYTETRHGVPADKYDARLVAALDAYPSQRAGFADVSRRFAAMLGPTQRSFEARFGPMTGFAPIILVHSLGEFDGGTRELPGGGRLMFGADMIDKLYRDTSPKAFFHHELFHLFHARTFEDCPSVACNLWNEGLATYVAATLNPGATDQELLLTFPAPIRPAVDANRTAAICAVRRRLDSTEAADNRALFSNGAPIDGLPQRFGYYVGYLVAAEAGRTRTLAELAQLDQAAARAVTTAALDRLATCA